MAPEVAAEAMRAYAEETNRLNRERQASSSAHRHALAETEKAIREIVRVVEQGGAHRALLDRLTGLEARQDELTARLAQAPSDAPVIHPNIANLYRRKVERLAEALSHPDDATEAALALRELIDRIVITPGPKRGEVNAVLHGDLEVILDWAARTQENANQAAASLRMSVPVKARACPEGLWRLQAEGRVVFIPAPPTSRAQPRGTLGPRDKPEGDGVGPQRPTSARPSWPGPAAGPPPDAPSSPAASRAWPLNPARASSADSPPAASTAPPAGGRS